MTNHRPFKFRIWDNYNQRFETCVYATAKDCYLFIGRLGYVTAFNCYGDEMDFEADRFIIQQFTGLTDKTGREIYEGDICRYKWDRHDHDIEESTGEVFFEDGIFFFGRKDLFCTSDSNFRVDSLEVIGNVFETPELLQPCSKN